MPSQVGLAGHGLRRRPSEERRTFGGLGAGEASVDEVRGRGPLRVAERELAHQPGDTLTAGATLRALVSDYDVARTTLSAAAGRAPT
jgi:hypothetical protein